MKQLIVWLTVGLTLGCSGSSLRPDFMSSGPGKFKLRPFRDVTLKNGLKVLLIKDTTLPFISLGMLIKVGSYQDPVGQSGVSEMVVELLDKGTRQHSANELADQMAEYAGEFNASAGADATYAAASALSFHQNILLKHFAEIITEASFVNVEIDRLRKRQLAQIRQLADDPEAITDVAFADFLYGKHPYGHTSPRARELKALSKKHITKHYLQYFRPGNASLAVVGNYSSDIVSRLEEVFGGWTDRPVKPTTLIGYPPSSGIQLLVLDRRDLSQDQIRFGHQGVKRDNPDFVALRLANTILGGGFASRLMQEVRVRRGLTYSISSGFDARLDEGPFEISTFTRHEKIGETIREVLRVVNEYKTMGATEEEIREAKALLTGQFPRTLETPEALASNLLYLRFYGVGDSYLSSYLAKVDGLTLQEVNRVIRKYLQPENFKIVIHAPRAKALPQIQGLGKASVRGVNEFL